MFKLLKWPFKIIILCAAIYGVLQVPVEGKPLWEHIQKTVVLQVSRLSKNTVILSKAKDLIKKNEILRAFSPQNDKKPKEHIKASEEERLEKILSGKE
ncbi:MAG: hypothetical protein A2Z91_03220 [Deltaproteobacteria bacterium GWA2_38_16]|nr:MAG: hypothetical protein A2Z91_03220 [Deltaproteobacteria bacterium GWA2_38_16]OGQ02896.1 MAG: hypothetical protein A3D19_06650 [Deltaproteobacteria bacterium RIFCSPHIGHO2_02_FULL_38_15]OGQ35089.1 MAG: hypothetical protein A3A72_03530 [Deltaproteobacteria bacterium RIFCSPLOWO2_01_FULL_38_9]OGQ63426.1 MAG: hypothetical protein A3G92_07035 [Deltaproteobacteria bacterium RIFCSPLOWO2_12_FULL_38_8]HBQ21743.1 hypothetical protein [Deltaproteobacteria bacterium]